MEGVIYIQLIIVLCCFVFPLHILNHHSSTSSDAWLDFFLRIIIIDEGKRSLPFVYCSCSNISLRRTIFRKRWSWNHNIRRSSLHSSCRESCWILPWYVKFSTFYFSGCNFNSFEYYRSNSRYYFVLNPSIFHYLFARRIHDQCNG